MPENYLPLLYFGLLSERRDPILERSVRPPLTPAKNEQSNAAANVSTKASTSIISRNPGCFIKSRGGG